MREKQYKNFGKLPEEVQKNIDPDLAQKYKKGGKVKFIQKAIKKPGSLRKSIGVKKGMTIPKAKLKAAAKKPGKLGQRARFAITLGKLRKK